MSEATEDFSQDPVAPDDLTSTNNDAEGAAVEEQQIESIAQQQHFPTDSASVAVSDGGAGGGDRISHDDEG